MPDHRTVITTRIIITSYYMDDIEISKTTNHEQPKSAVVILKLLIFPW